MNSENKTIDSRETKGITAMLIVEVIGRPPEHLTETLTGIIQKIGEEKDVIINRQKINEPVLMKDSKDFYTSFAEIEIEVEEVSTLAVLTQKYMPAYIEVISPEVLTLTNNSWNEILNDFVRKLHMYDEVTRVVQMREAQMQKELKELKGKKE